MLDPCTTAPPADGYLAAGGCLAAGGIPAPGGIVADAATGRGQAAEGPVL